jgi:hypothetical protein
MGIPATEHDIFYAGFLSRFRRDPHGVPRKVKAMQRQEASEMLGGYLLEEHRHRPAQVRRNKELDKSPCKIVNSTFLTVPDQDMQPKSTEYHSKQLQIHGYNISCH